jgi:hypothetical protein
VFDEDATFLCLCTIVGEAVEVLHHRSGRRELIATCQRDGRRYDVALLDLDIQADPATSQVIAAYRRWNQAF